jgi:zinc protease
MNAALLLALAALTDPAPVVDGDVTEAHVAGVTVLVKTVPHAELVTSQLYVRGGARNWTKADAGVEALAFRVAANGGTQALDKIAFGQKLASLGVNVGADTTLDWSVLEAKGPLAAVDPALDLLVDCFLRPAMPASELEVQRQQQLAVLKHRRDDPDGRLGELVDATMFRGTVFENPQDGTVEVVEKLTAQQLSAHLAKLRETSRLVLVVVGDVDAAKVIAKVKGAFAKVPAGSYAPKKVAAPTFAGNALVGEERKLPTNYIQGMFPVAAYGAPDNAAGVALMNILWDRLFEEVRTKRNLSYAPGLRMMRTDSFALGGIYVTAVDPNATLPVMFHELKRMQTELLDDKDLAAAKALSRTGMLMGEETTDGQATALARALLLGGDWRYERKLPEQIAALTAKDIQAYAKKYFAKMQLVVLGDPKKLDEKIAKSF